MLQKGKGMCLLYETGVEYCCNCSQVNNILMSSNKESKAIKREKIISRESCCTSYTPRAKGIIQRKGREGKGERERGEYWILARFFDQKIGKSDRCRETINSKF